jgi:hypothetical protein
LVFFIILRDGVLLNENFISSPCDLGHFRRLTMQDFRRLIAVTAASMSHTCPHR